jgi:hypothetical protein
MNPHRTPFRTGHASTTIIAAVVAILITAALLTAVIRLFVRDGVPFHDAVASYHRHMASR